MRRLLLLVFFSVAVARVLDVSGEADEPDEPIKCYVCDSTKDSRCEDPFSYPADLLMTCPGDRADSCMKKNFEGGTERCCLCSNNDTTPGCCGKHGPGRIVSTVSLCFADGCNGSA